MKILEPIHTIQLSPTECHLISMAILDGISSNPDGYNRAVTELLNDIADKLDKMSRNNRPSESP